MKNSVFFAALAIALCFLACEKPGADTPKLTKITVTDARTIYLIDSTFNKNGILVTAFYSDGTSAAVKDYTFTGFDGTKTGKQTITVNYQGKIASFTVTVAAEGYIGMAEVTGGQWFSMGSEADGTPHQVIVTCFYM